MKMRMKPQGYTVVETLIFLAVTSALLVSAITITSGQQNRTEFAQAIREMDSQIQDIINDVATGYYTNTNNFKCVAPGPSGKPTITSNATNDQGANLGCVFVGRVLEFQVGSVDSNQFNIFTVVGRQKTSSPAREVQNLTEAEPIAIAPNSLGTVPVSALDTRLLMNNLIVSTMSYISGGVTIPISSVGFISTFGQYNAAGTNLISGDQSVNLIPIPGSLPGESAVTTADKINTLTDVSPKNPDSGVIICFNSGSTNQQGIITIGSNGRKLSTKLEIKDGSC